MGILKKIKKLFGKGDDLEALQSDLKRFSSDLKRSNKRFKALESASNRPINSQNEEKSDDFYENTSSSGLKQLSRPKPEDEDSVELQKESLQLGVAAGYTGRAIKEIESSLNRIESQMASKDWISSKIGNKSDKSLELLLDVKDMLQEHDKSASNRLEAIQSALNRMSNTARMIPEPIRKELLEDIASIETNLPLTPKMQELVDTVKSHNRISYGDLVRELDVTRSSLRGLISNTIKRTDEIERFSVEGKGWVRYKYPKTTQISKN